MCQSPNDYCISAYIDRNDDFRGCGSMYRAGSIFNGGGYSTCQAIGDIFYNENTGDFYDNADNYGVTTPIIPVHRHSGSFETRLNHEQSPLAKPQQNPEEYLIPESHPEFHREPGNTLPSVDDLLNQPRRGTMPMPIIPPAKLKTSPSFEDTPIETIPFSPNDETIPPNIFPITTEPPITLEELRRLDPSVQDVQIISIEDTTALF